MNCRQAGTIHQAYLDGELSNQVRVELDSHVIRCGRCQESLALLEAVGNVIAQPPLTALSDDFTDRLLDKALAATPTVEDAWRRRVGRATRFVSAAAALVALTMLLPVFRGGDGRPDPSELVPFGSAEQIGDELALAGPGPGIVEPLLDVLDVRLPPSLQNVGKDLNDRVLRFVADGENASWRDFARPLSELPTDVAGS